MAACGDDARVYALRSGDLCRSARRQAMRFFLLLATGVLLAAGAGAAEPPGGAANFRPPGYVPDYFSNESGPFRGASGAVAAPSSAAPVVAAPAPDPAVAVPRQVSRPSLHAAKVRGHRRTVGRQAATRGHALHTVRARVGKPPHTL